MIIDLRSDTFTIPTPEMLEAMFQARVGDDVFDEDPTIKALEHKLAGLFGKDRGLFVPSGTMSNQIAIKVHTQPGDEVICNRLSHIYQYEGGGIAFNSGASVALIDREDGQFSLDDLKYHLNDSEDQHKAYSKLVSLENTCNKAGGTIWQENDVVEISTFCRENGYKIHLDGARIFNALAETKDDPIAVGNQFDTVSICLSKGLGAPVGSVLVGNSQDMWKAKRIRKVFGGAMRQAGYLAAAGIYALDHHIDRLTKDHINIRKLADALRNCVWTAHVPEPQTNILIFSIAGEIGARRVLTELDSLGIKALSLSQNTIRFVTHLDISDKMIDEAVEKIEAIQF
jgi:threonine aldolase